MKSILKEFQPISLDQMKEIRLMNRTDTKFVTTKSALKQLLELAREKYYAQEIDGSRIARYYTVYYDTPGCDMFRRHACGHLNRQKIRIRSYVDSAQSFLEIKTKNNHGRTKKKRTVLESFRPASPDYQAIHGDHAFIVKHLRYDPEGLQEQLENRFERITLVNRAKTERLTIDLNLRFHNLATGADYSCGDIVIIELKRDSLAPSPILPLLRRLHIHQSGFSKYCIGSALTNPGLRTNRFKIRLRRFKKLTDNI